MKSRIRPKTPNIFKEINKWANHLHGNPKMDLDKRLLIMNAVEAYFTYKGVTAPILLQEQKLVNQLANEFSQLLGYHSYKELFSQPKIDDETFIALAGPHSDTLFKMMEIRQKNQESIEQQDR